MFGMGMPCRSAHRRRHEHRVKIMSQEADNKRRWEQKGRNRIGVTRTYQCHTIFDRFGRNSELNRSNLDDGNEVKDKSSKIQILQNRHTIRKASECRRTPERHTVETVGYFTGATYSGGNNHAPAFQLRDVAGRARRAVIGSRHSASASLHFGRALFCCSFS